MSNCIRQTDNITQSVSVALPQHEMVLQMNVSGPYFIGGFRLCLRGPGRKNSNYRLQALDACQVFWTSRSMASQHSAQQNPSSAKQHRRLKLLVWRLGLASLKRRQRKQKRETVPCDLIFTSPYQSNSDVDIE
ncbi:unnamed protein product [Rotaria magnacalcarata]|uniref:Uncharacterized protein n=1 Tax=Rotaria magnacalcarata TaxID=392030 RepID=A0A816WSZ7_9BILA|nr:unnamed protein product [Rotaria magnacalcarata]CAF3920124.1 unnamed protein product [Rotaria magnacalcarata]